MNQKLDYITIIFIVVLVISGLVAIYSATRFDEANSSIYFNKQLIWTIVGFILMAIIIILPIRQINRLSYSLYLINLLLLILVLFIGKAGQGAERWLVFGPVRIQPSEFMKLTTLLAVSKFLSDKYADVNKLKYLIICVALIIIPFVLIAKQPDLGTSLVLLAIIIPILFWSGLNWFYLFVMISPLLTMIFSFNLWAFMGMMLTITLILLLSKRKILLTASVFMLNIGIGIVTPTMWNQLHPYQQKRIITFINPEKDPRGAGYQIIQSQVAIGSGGIWGKGYLQGSQTHLRFLPAQHTDFIFSVIGEEFGFFGVGIILLTFLLLLLRLINLAGLIRHQYGSLLIIGITTIIAFHIVINVGMTIGLAPVTGLPLPFLSYGGSFLLVNFMMIGIVLNIARNRLLVL